MPIIINSKFRPFSFQEMLQPVAMAAQAHQALEDSYSELDTKASIWEKLKDSEIDRDVYQQYKAYSDALRSSSDELAQFGLTPSSRRAMLDMRARYSQDIIPIEQAWNERDRQMKVQQEMMLKDPTHMYRVNAGQVGLREYMSGNYDALTDNYSGALLTKQASDIATNLKAALTDRSKLKSLGLPYQYERMLQYGFTPEQVDAAVRGDANANPILTQIINQVLQGSGISQWDNYDAIKDKVRGFIGQGIYSAIGTKKYEHFTDNFSMQDALNANQFKRQKDAEEEKQRELLGLAANPLNLYTPEERAKIDDNIKKFSKYFIKGADGEYQLTKEGLAEYRRLVASGETPLHDTVKKSGNFFTRATMNTPDAQIGEQHEGRTNKTSPSEFRKFIDGLGIKPVDGKILTKDIGKVFGQYMKENDVTQYDARKRTEFGYAIDDSQRAQIKGLISTALSGLDGLEEVRFDGESGQFVPTSNKMSKSDLKSDKTKVLDIRFSPYGSTVMIENEDGEVRRYRMPAGINPRNEDNRNRKMEEALYWQNIATYGTYESAGKTIQATPEEIAHAQEQYKSAIQEAYLYHSQLGLTNKTKEQEFNPYAY